MNTVSDEKALQRFSRSVYRSMLEVSQHYQRLMMQLLEGERGHSQLKLNFQEPIFAIPKAGIRPTELAGRLNMKKQNAGQLLKQIEAAGYVEYVTDPADARARLVKLSEHGVQLISDAIEVTASIDHELQKVLGESEFLQLHCSVKALAACFDSDKSRQPGDGEGSVFIGDLIVLNDRASIELMRRLRQRGYAEFKPSFRYILMHLGEGGSRIQAIAREHQVSKQAIARTTAEMEKLGYVELLEDPCDKRSKIIHLGKRGLALVTDSVEVADGLSEELTNAIGDKAFRSVEREFAELQRYFSAGALGGGVNRSSIQAGEQAMLAALVDIDRRANGEHQRLLESVPGEPGRYRLKQSAIDFLAGVTVDTAKLLG